MNFHYLIRRLAGRPTCTKHPSARLSARARIINIGSDSRRITIGASSIIAGELLVFPHGGQISVGEWCYIGEGTHIWSDSRIEIGDRVMISHNVNVFDNLTHPLAPMARHQHFRQIATIGHPKHIDLGGRPVRIQDDAWIAAGSIILRGVEIGKAAIVGAGAVVTHDVPPHSIVAGNPARVIRMLKSIDMDNGDAAA